VENDVVSSCPPAWKAPSPVSAQAKAVIGLTVSVEVDTSETLWPISGKDGNQLNDAAGGGGPAGAEGGVPGGAGPVATGGGLDAGVTTVNVTGRLSAVIGVGKLGDGVVVCFACAV